MALLVKLKSGQMVALDAIVAITKANENWSVRLMNGDSVVIEPDDLNLFETDMPPATVSKPSPKNL